MTRPRYRGTVYDSARWEGFEHRPGDIVISTPPKCGTTWTQMICALLIFQTPDLDRPLAMTSPWIDMVTRPRREVFDDLALQSHRRFLKTHTPLDGLPADPSVTYLCVGRDPRDVGLSMDAHRANMDMGEVIRAITESAAVDGIEPPTFASPPPRPPDLRDRFWAWVDADGDPTVSNPDLRYTVAHLQSFWSAPDSLDVVMLHYDDLKADLPGEMRRLADRLGIDVPEDRWPQLVDAASLESMRSRADQMVPGAGRDQWHDPARFFHKGTSGQWREVLDDAGVARYADRVRSLGSPDLVEWLHHADPLPDA